MVERGWFQDIVNFRPFFILHSLKRLRMKQYSIYSNQIKMVGYWCISFQTQGWWTTCTFLYQYKVHSKGFGGFYFEENLHAQKLNKAQTKKSKITGVTILAHINREWCHQLCLLSFIVSLHFASLVILHPTSLFCLFRRHRQSMTSPWPGWA